MNNLSSKLEVAIGPLTSIHGGVGRVLRYIHKFSEHNVSVFRVPFLSKKILSFRQKHGRKFYDPYGLYLKNSWLENFDIVQLSGHPLFEEVFFRSKKSVSKFVYRLPGFWGGPPGFIKKNEPYYESMIRQDNLMIEVCKHSDKIIVTTPYFQHYLRKHYNLDSVVIGNSTDVKFWMAGDSSRFRRRFNLKNQICLFAGKLRSDTEPTFFLKLAEKFPSKDFVMIGARINRENVEHYCQMSVPENVSCLGELSSASLADAFSASHVVFYASPSVFAGNVPMEAMASGSIALRSFHKDFPNDDFFFKNGEEGIFYEQYNLSDCAEKLERAWNDDLMGIKARILAIKKHDWRIGIKHYDELYSSLV